MHLDDSGIETESLDPDTHYSLSLEFLKHSIEDTRFGPGPHTGVDGMPDSKLFREATPFTAIFCYIENSIEDMEVRVTSMITRRRKTVSDFAILPFVNFHAARLCNQDKFVKSKLTGPSINAPTSDLFLAIPQN
jgi:hypothetical protein